MLKKKASDEAIVGAAEGHVSREENGSESCPAAAPK